VLLCSKLSPLLDLTKAMNQTPPTESRPRKKHHDWYDKCTLGLLGATFLALVIYTSVTACLALLTGDAVKVATRATDIADKQLAVATDTENRQLRAYLYVEHGPLKTLSNDNHWGADIVVRHAGATPAYKIELYAKIEVGPYLLNATKLLPPSDPPLQYAILYGNKTIEETISTMFLFDTIQEVKNANPLYRDQRFYLHGRVLYSDIFSKEWPYQFCFVFHPDRGPKGSGRGCEEYNKPG
jgi:hypothetical protein